MNNLATNGRIEDIAVAREQKGKKFGLRILEALIHISAKSGCHKVRENPLIKYTVPIITYKRRRL
jgi:hypothetical protein